MKTKCCVLLLLFCAVVSGRELPDKCAGPFDASSVTFYKAEGIGPGRSCDMFGGIELPMDEALGLFVRLTALPASNESKFSRQKESTKAALAPSKACILENWEMIGGKPTTFQFRPCTPSGCTDPPNGRRRRNLMMITPTQGVNLSGLARDGEAGITACNGHCCVMLFIKEATLKALAR